MPSLHMKELAFGQCMFKNCLLIPKLPEDLGIADEVGQLKAMDITVDASTGKREDYKRSAARLEKWCNIYFVHMRPSAYIARAWHMLIIYLNMPFRQ